MKRLLISLALALAVIAAGAQDKIVLRLMGDSTMADKDLSYQNPERGWGQRLKSHVDEGVVVANYAQNGRSTKSVQTLGIWDKVKADGVEFAIIRIAYRGYGSGEIVTDEQAVANIKNATKAGVKVGVYFFSQAINEKEAEEEAEYVIDIIDKYKIEYPIVFDMEEINGDTARTDKLTKEEKTDIAIAFCEKVKEEKYTPMVYANIKWFAGYYDMKRLEAYDKWFAYYDDTLYFPYKIKMWQYTDSGKVDGIAGNVDLNIYVE